MKLFHSKYTIAEHFDTHHLPVYYVIRTFYIGSFSLCAQLYGREGKDLPFYDIKDAQDYLKLLTEKC